MRHCLEIRELSLSFKNEGIFHFCKVRTDSPAYEIVTARLAAKYTVIVVCN